MDFGRISFGQAAKEKGRWVIVVKAGYYWSYYDFIQVNCWTSLSMFVSSPKLTSSNDQLSRRYAKEVSVKIGAKSRRHCSAAAAKGSQIIPRHHWNKVFATGQCACVYYFWLALEEEEELAAAAAAVEDWSAAAAAAAGAGVAAAAVDSLETTLASARFSDFSRSFSLFNVWRCCGECSSASGVHNETRMKWKINEMISFTHAWDVTKRREGNEPWEKTNGVHALLVMRFF